MARPGRVQIALGAPAPVPVNVRVVAATHREIESLVADGRFRHDLYYRLNVITVRVPPLRVRPEDILPLATHFLVKHGNRLGRLSCTLSSEVVNRLKEHPWPGNVRELENAIERALVLGRDDVIWIQDLPETLRRSLRPEGAGGSDARSLAEVEREHILRTLRSAHGNKDAVVTGRSPVLEIVANEAWVVTKISDDPFLPVTKARMIAADLDLFVGF